MLNVDLLDVSLRLHIRLSLLLELVEGTLDLGNVVAHISHKGWLLDSRWVRADVSPSQKHLLGGLTCKLRSRCELARQTEHVQDVLVSFVAEIAIQVKLKGDETEHEVLVVEQVLDGLILDEMEFDLEEVTMA